MTLRDEAARLAAALYPFIDRAAADELANNVALALADGTEEPAVVLDSAIRHRVNHFGLVCGDIRSAVACGARVWRRGRWRAA